MKNKFIYILILLFIITGCTKKQENKKEEDNNMIQNSNSLVLYFSATGNTKIVANKLSKVLNSDIIEIVPKNKYTNDDLDYNNDNSRANKEQNDSKARPEILNNIDISSYNTIYLGYPIWWGSVPKIILTLLDSYNFEGKKIILFCTSGSSGISKSIEDLKQYNKNINFIDGKRFEVNVSEEELNKWASKYDEINKIYIKINDKVLTASLENNISAKELVSKLKKQDITLEMSDYGNFEKVGNLGFELSRSDQQISVDYGDIILYQGDKITIYYDSNNWNFTKLGKIDNIKKEELKNILGKGSVKVTFTLNSK